MQVSEKPTRKSPRKRLSQTAVTNIKLSPSKVRKVIIQDHAYTSEPCEPAAASKEISTLRNEMRILKQKRSQNYQHGTPTKSTQGEGISQ